MLFFTQLQQAFQQNGVFWIYWIFLICLTLQIFFTLRTWQLPKARREIFALKTSFFSEWAINVPPTLGVLGTIIAMAIAIGSKGTTSPEDFMELFIQNFWAAVSTTILGGIVYTVNLGLHAIIDLLSFSQS